MKFAFAVIAALGSLSCGYHVAGHSDLIPKADHTVYVDAFTNGTIRYKLTDRVPEAIAHEFISRSPYRVIPDKNNADLILSGSVLNYLSFPTTFDQTTGRAAAVEVHVILRVTLTERATGKVLYTRPNLEVRDRYEISLTESQYFDESDAAIRRIATSVGQQVVSGVLQAF